MPQATKLDVYLVPGFFGFTFLGDVKYFAHVRDVLGAALERRAADVAIHYVPSRPTASLRQRAGRLADYVDATARGHGAEVHLVGHSSGGLDARLLVSPGVELPAQSDVPTVAAAVRSIVTVSTPHHGTPLAAFFASVSGQRLLRLLSLASVYVLRRGTLPVSAAATLLRVLSRARRGGKAASTVVDQLFDRLLGDFSPERQHALREFLEDVYSDQALLPQIAPEAAELLHATLVLPKHVRGGSVVAASPPPRLLNSVDHGLDTYAQTAHALYRWLHAVTAGPGRAPDRPIDGAAAARLVAGLGQLPAPGWSDGVVPTRSQVWGEVIAALRADHLDVIGHFDEPDHDPPHFDWLPSGSRFDRQAFEETWDLIAEFLVG